MPEVLIRYCVPCRYEFKAIQDADAILREFGDELTDLRLVPGPRGAYDVEVDGKLVFSLETALRFPETSELIRKIRARIKPRKARKKA